MVKNKGIVVVLESEHTNVFYKKAGRLWNINGIKIAIHHPQ